MQGTSQSDEMSSLESKLFVTSFRLLTLECLEIWQMRPITSPMEV